MILEFAIKIVLGGIAALFRALPDATSLGLGSMATALSGSGLGALNGALPIDTMLSALGVYVSLLSVTALYGFLRDIRRMLPFI